MASILETFYILFEAKGADSVKKGADEAGRSTEDLERRIVSTDAAATALGDHLIASVKSLGGIIAGAFAASAVYEGIKAQNEYNVQLLHTSQLIGLNVEDLAAYDQAVIRQGGVTGSFAQSIGEVNRNVERLATTGTSRLKKVFEDLRIRVLDAPHHARPLLAILGDLSERLHGMSRERRAGIGELLQLDPATLLLLSKGRDGVAQIVEQMKALGVPTQEDAERAEQLEIEIDNLTQTLDRAYTIIASAIVPAITAFGRTLESVVGYLGSHKTLVEGFFIGLSVILVETFAPALVAATAAVLGFIASWLLVPALFAALAAAFALVYDDIVNFLEGNKSVIGELAKRWPIVGETVRALADAFVFVGRTAQDIFHGVIYTIGEVIKAIKELIGWLDIAGNRQPKNVDRGKFINDLNKPGFNPFEAGAKGLQAFLNWGYAPNAPARFTFADSLAAGKSAIAGANASPFNTPVGASTGGGRPPVTLNFGDVTINTQATDADGIAGSFKDLLTTHISHAINQFDDGVRG